MQDSTMSHFISFGFFSPFYSAFECFYYKVMYKNNKRTIYKNVDMCSEVKLVLVALSVVKVFNSISKTIK